MKKHLLLIVVSVIFISLCNAQNPILWGMTTHGGNGDGTIFQTDTTGTLTTRFNFSGVTNGADLYGNLIQVSDTLLYGLTFQGGANDEGSIISYNISTGKETLLYNFGNDTDGMRPNASLIQAYNGLLYGTTLWGGTNYLSLEGANGGTIFSYNLLTGTENVLHNFGKDSDAALPVGSLIQAKDSLLYGTTVWGGSINTPIGGTIFSYNIATNTETVLHNFGGIHDGIEPQGSLTLVNDSLLYGMTSGGGIYGRGTIFSYNISTGKENVVHNFNKVTDGNTPIGSSFIQASNGLLYGMTRNGGTYDSGTIFSYNISMDSEAVLHSFGSGTDGKYPYGSLIQASNSSLYGMTEKGGANDSGIIFSYNISSNKETDRHNFAGSDGDFPYGDLLEVVNANSGINQLSVNSNRLYIYPNPTSGQFTIKLPANQTNYSVEIYNMLGEKVYQFILNNSQNTVDLNSQPDGMYFIYLKSDEGVEVGKVLVTK